MQNILSSLNRQQKQAVKDTSQLVLVTAGPGTGKTLTLIAKILSLIESGKNPQQIAAITFTRRAAQEIKERLKLQLGDQVDQLNLGTFHSFALQNLDIEAQQLLSEERQRRLVKTLIRQYNLQVKVKGALLLIDRIKNHPQLIKTTQPGLQKLYQQYQQYLDQEQLFDFQDLLSNLNQAIEQGCLEQYKYLLVDEFQDVSPLQYRLVKNWAEQLNQTFVIGDPRQAIYGFRGAAAQTFDQLKTDFLDIASHQLKINYRSGPDILKTAQRLFPQDAPPVPHLTHHGQVQLIRTVNPYTEANWILADIERKLGGTGLVQASQFHQETEASLSEFAVIYRIHQLGAIVENKIKDAGLPYQKAGSESLFVQPDARLVIDLFKLAAAQKHQTKQQSADILENNILQLHDSDLSKVLSLLDQENLTLLKAVKKILDQQGAQLKTPKSLRFILETVNQLKAEILDEKSSMELVDSIKQQLSKFELLQSDDDLAHILQLKVELLQFADAKQPLTAFLDYVNHLEKLDFYDERADKISLLSMHAAKGLEFDWVYLVGFEQGLVPLNLKSTKNQFSIGEAEEQHQEQQHQEEERNLFFVTLTRAKKGISLLQTKQRWKKQTKPSPFLQEIKNDHLQIKTDEQLEKFKKRQAQLEQEKRQGSLF